MITIGLVVGAVVTAFVAQRRIFAERDRADAAERDLLQARGDLGAELVGLRTALEAERRGTAEKVAALTHAREELLATVRESCGEVMDGRGRQLVDHLKAELAAGRTEHEADLERRQRAVEDVVAPIRRTLGEMGETLQRVDRGHQRTNAELGERLRGVVDAQREVRTETASLARALRQPQARGRWGELHLRRVVELAGMTARCDFTEQQRVDGVLRPDLVVHLPGGRDVVTDAKTPIQPFLDACEAEDPVDRDRHLQRYARGVREQVDALAAKDYAAHFPTAPDFVVLYLPGESFFAAAVEADPGLIEHAAARDVLLATPTTLIVLLKTIAQAWQQQTVATEAQAIAHLGRQLHDRLSTYLTHVDLVSKRLNSLVDAQNKAVGSLERNVLPTARRFPALGAVAANRELSEVRPVELTARAVQARELPAPRPEAA